MTDQEKRKLKSYLLQYLRLKGVAVNIKRRSKNMRCPNPSHQDENPSATYKNSGSKINHPFILCPVCDKNFDIFDCVNFFDGKKKFNEQIELLQYYFNIESEPKKNKEKKTKNKTEPVPLSEKDAKKIYDIKFVAKKGVENEWGEITKSWKYDDKNNKIIGVDVKYETDNNKVVITWWYNGKNLAWYDNPVLIYNLFEALQTDKPILIHEGAGCAELANKKIPHFCSISWSGGASRSHQADWKILSGKEEIYIYPDDDKKSGDDLPVGLKAAKNIQAQLPHAKIISPVLEARKIKKYGADIVEALQVKNVNDLIEYITSSESVLHLSLDTPGTDSGEAPFKILGIADDGKAYFIDCSGRLINIDLKNLNRGHLKVLAPAIFWNSKYSFDGKFSFESAADDIIRISQSKDFDYDSILGRGAWNNDGKICYHDGRDTYGEISNDKLFLRKRKIDIGINDKSATKSMCNEIKSVASELSFETPADMIKCLGWCVLAPFCGALSWRPMILLTGESGWGKSTIGNLLIKRLAVPKYIDSNTSTIAGLRGSIKNDSVAVLAEETDTNTEKQKERKRELMAVMRSSSSDDAPDSIKGTADQHYTSYKMRNMFCYIGTDPTIEEVADENRIHRVNLKKPDNKNKWKEIKKSLNKLLSINNCRSIRALTWDRLKDIINLSEELVDEIIDRTNSDYRTAFADSILAAAYIVVWCYTAKPSGKALDDFFLKFYEWKRPEERRNSSEEILQKILDEMIEVVIDNVREKLSISEILIRIICGKKESGRGLENIYPDELVVYNNTLARHGIRVIDEDKIAIANNHDSISKIIKKSFGYSKYFKRNSNCVEVNKNVYFPGGGRKSSIFKNIIDVSYFLEVEKRK